MNRTKVILSIFLMLFLLLAGLVLPSFWKSQKKEVSGNKGREPAKETAETNFDTWSAGISGKRPVTRCLPLPLPMLRTVRKWKKAVWILCLLRRTRL